MSSIYARLVILSMKDRASIPRSMGRYTLSNGYSYDIQLRGERAITMELETIASLVKTGKLNSVYISPFENTLVDTDQLQLFHSLYKRFPAGWDRDGCGAAVLDVYQKGMLYCAFSSKNRKPMVGEDVRSIEETGWRSFYTETDASNFIMDFIRSGIEQISCQEMQPVDPKLLQWLCNTRRQAVKVPADLEQITELRAEDFSRGVPAFPDWLCPVYGDWRLIGHLPRLEKLEFPHVCIDNFSFLLKCRHLIYLDLSKTNFYEGIYLEHLENLKTLILPPAQITGFSFLRKCGHLAFLDLSKTNFTECSLLLELRELEAVYLPSKENLLHFEAMESMMTKVYTDEPEPEREILPGVYLSSEKLPLGENGFYAQSIVTDGVVYREKHISKEMVQALVKRIRAGSAKSLTVSADLEMEDVVFTAHIEGGWAALVLQDFERDVYYVPDNEGYRDSIEPAPPKIGGQSPITKAEALEDLRIASECVRHYIKSGKLSPKVRWVRTN